MFLRVDCCICFVYSQVLILLFVKYFCPNRDLLRVNSGQTKQFTTKLLRASQQTQPGPPDNPVTAQHRDWAGEILGLMQQWRLILIQTEEEQYSLLLSKLYPKIFPHSVGRTSTTTVMKLMTMQSVLYVTGQLVKIAGRRPYLSCLAILTRRLLFIYTRCAVERRE